MNSQTPTETEKKIAEEIAYYFPPPTTTTATIMVQFQRIDLISKQLIKYKEEITKNYKDILLECEKAIQDSLRCLEGLEYEYGIVIYDEEPYALQKKTLKKIKDELSRT